MKSTHSPLVLIGSIGIAAAALFSSCADPYYSARSEPIREVPSYRPGYQLRELPSGYRTEVIGGTRYYIDRGTYYRPRSGGYVVVDSPVRPTRSHRGPVRNEGYIVRLPPGYRAETHRGTRYYRSGNTYYQESGRGYIAVPRPF